MKKCTKLLSIITSLILAFSSIPAVNASAFSIFDYSPSDCSANGKYGAAGIEFRYNDAYKALYIEGDGQLTNEIYNEIFDFVCNAAKYDPSDENYAVVSEVETVIIGKDVRLPLNEDGTNEPYNQFVVSTGGDTFYTYHGSDMEKQYEAFIRWCISTWTHQTEEEIRAKFPLHYLEDGEVYTCELPEDESGIFSKGGANWQFVGSKRLLYIGGEGTFPSQEFWDIVATHDVDYVVFGRKVEICDDDIISRNGVSCSRTLYELVKNINRMDEYIGDLTSFVYSQTPAYYSVADVLNYIETIPNNPFLQQPYIFRTLNENDVSLLAEYEEIGMQMQAEPIFGDVNLDGKIDLTDAILISKTVAGSVTLSPAQIANADIDGNGSIETADTVMLLQFLMHMIDSIG